MNYKFLSISTFGDMLFELCLMKYLGGGELYIKLNGLDEFCQKVLGWKDAGPHSRRLTEKDYYSIEPLLKEQSYLTKVSMWKGEEINHTAFMDNHWKMHLIKGWQGNQTECHALCVGLNIHDPEVRKKILFEPWLTVKDPIKIAGKPFVVSRTNRYLGDSLYDISGWNKFIQGGLSDYGVFVGSEEEHETFEKIAKIKIDYYKTNNLLDLARVIQGSEMFIGNQGGACTIAMGLGKTYWCEIRKDYMYTRTPHGGYGDNWFPRINGFYF